ncbi:MAG: hypothetical protein JXA33_10990 [Anaerolineae bacterium]|nr:hypothetical protein [Anaerolineae bacterium]
MLRFPSMAGKRDDDAVVTMVKHDEYRSLDLAALKAALRTPVVVDGRRVFEAEVSRGAGLRTNEVGIGK